jgi:uncharacterized protein YgiM (DUF1202 family)
MTRGLPIAALLVGALLPAAVQASSDPERVVVQDAYLELRSGPGRGYPVFHVVDRGADVALLRRRTDWIKVRDAGGQEGWVNRSQLEQTLAPDGSAVTLPAPTPEDRTGHRWEIGLVTGDLDGASVVSVSGAYALTPTLQLRGDVSHSSRAWANDSGLRVHRTTRKPSGSRRSSSHPNSSSRPRTRRWKTIVEMWNRSMIHE